VAEFEDVVSRVYEAAVEPDLWPSVLEDIGRIVQAPAVVLLTARNDSWVGWRRSDSVPHSAEDYLRSEATRRSQYLTWLRQADRAGFVPEHALACTPQEWLANPLMSHYATAAGFHHAAGTAINIPTGDVILVHLHRRRGLPRFTPRDVARLDALRPHLARAVMLAVRWRLERLRGAAEALALVGLPAVIVDSRGQVLVANSLIERMSSWIAWLPGDRMALLDAAANDMLRQAIAQFRDPAAHSIRSIPIRQGDSSEAAVVHAVPLIGRARDLYNGAFGIVVITPVAGAAAPAGSILHALFDLTPAEVRVASAIAEGLSPEQIALRHAVTIDTVRVQLKAVLAKTGTHRQAQVAALLAGLPKFPMT
jgi:DNA-binding CsgD family transcriptional regulator